MMQSHAISTPKVEYIQAIASGSVLEAYEIAHQRALFFENTGDLFCAGVWNRKLCQTLYYQGRYGDALALAEQWVCLQPDGYERARLLVMTAWLHSLRSN